jgi:glycerol-3-phosphate acyltransferase PlsY
MKIVFMRGRGRGACVRAAFARIAAILPPGSHVIAAALIVAGAYLLGSISFAVVVSRAFGLPDPHEYGSGNPGATNVLRTGNRKAALLTLLGDGLKGYVAVTIAQFAAARLGAPDWTVPVAAIAVFVGHILPVFHGFRGGKGVATGAGIVFGLHWPLGLVLTAIWLLMAFGFKISSLAALVAALLMPIGMFYVQGATLTAWAMVPIAVLLFWRHKENIRQLVQGRERPIGR